MTNEKLERANKLSTEIEAIEKQIETWEQGTSIYSIKMDCAYSNRAHYYAYPSPECIDFALLKTITLATLQHKKERLQKEFDAL